MSRLGQFVAAVVAVTAFAVTGAAYLIPHQQGTTLREDIQTHLR